MNYSDDNPTPILPKARLNAPPAAIHTVVNVKVAHLGNPLLAVQRLLANEAKACATVTGNEEQIHITVALPDNTQAQRELALEWIAWSIHHAGIQGTVLTEAET